MESRSFIVLSSNRLRNQSRHHHLIGWLRFLLSIFETLLLLGFDWEWLLLRMVPWVKEANHYTWSWGYLFLRSFIQIDLQGFQLFFCYQVMRCNVSLLLRRQFVWIWGLLLLFDRLKYFKFMVNCCFLYIWRRWLYYRLSWTLIDLEKLTLLPGLLIFGGIRIFNGLIFDCCLIVLFSILWNACTQSTSIVSKPRFLNIFNICDSDDSILLYNCIIIFNYRF